jgi:hypothetical protein
MPQLPFIILLVTLLLPRKEGAKVNSNNSKIPFTASRDLLPPSVQVSVPVSPVAFTVQKKLLHPKCHPVLYPLIL